MDPVIQKFPGQGLARLFNESEANSRSLMKQERRVILGDNCGQMFEGARLHGKDEDGGLAAQGAQLLARLSTLRGRRGRHGELAAAAEAEKRLRRRQEGKDRVCIRPVCRRQQHPRCTHAAA